MMSPTKPMIPQNATQSAVITDARTSIRRLKRLTFRPSCFACSSPIMNRLYSLAHSMATIERIITGTKTSQAFSQVTFANEPYSHHMVFWMLSRLSVRNIVWTDENAKPTMVPARM